jgi:hypothetical protein
MDARQRLNSVGRPRKDRALKARDSYWAWTLKHLLPLESFASIERRLCPHVKVTSRGDGEGKVQPFALSKVASLKRGLSYLIDGEPEVVLRAEEWVPGSASAFSSLLWPVLYYGMDARGIRLSDGVVAPEVRRRLHNRHFAGPHEEWTLNELGVRRVGRIVHRDALALILLHCPHVVGVTPVSVLAEEAVPLLLDRLCRFDPAMRAIQEEVQGLVAERFPDVLTPGQANRGRAFPRRPGMLSLGLRAVLGPSAPLRRA